MSRHRSVTIKDIARRFNCSPSTVSRALNDHPSINALTRLNIQEYAREIDYQRNSVSLSLLNQQSYTIGVVLPDVAGFFEAAVIDGIQSIIHPNGYTLNICLTRESHKLEAEYIKKLLSVRVDGIFVEVAQETQDFAHLEQITRRRVPLILIDRDCPTLPAHRVTVDDYNGAFLAVEHLIRVGCQRIAHLSGPKGLSVSEHRLQGYLDALRKYGHPFRPEYLLPAGFSVDRALYPMQQLLEMAEPPDGLFAVNDNIAIGAMHVIRERGLRIPEDIAVVGFDNDAHAAYYSPSLSTVAQPAFELGKVAARLFLDQVKLLDKPEETPLPSPADFDRIVLPSELIIRDSSLRIGR